MDLAEGADVGFAAAGPDEPELAVTTAGEGGPAGVEMGFGGDDFGIEDVGGYGLGVGGGGEE